MRIIVPDMLTQKCADSITKALIAQDGVNHVSCDLVNKAVDVTCNAVFPDVVKKAIENLGYTVETTDSPAN